MKIRQIKLFFFPCIVALYLLLFGAKALGQSKELPQDTTLRGAVVRVVPQLSSRSAGYLQSLSQRLQVSGARETSDLLADYAEQGFATGVIIEQLGRNYVLTSRSAVELAVYATIHFAEEEFPPLKDCPILYSETASELALIALPEGFRATVTLSLATVVAEEREVVIPGFTGFGEGATWNVLQGKVLQGQHSGLGYGVDTTRFYIQHNVPVEPGLTGSPLLVSDENGYAIAGVNLWKAGVRGAVGLAVPLDIVNRFVHYALSVNEEFNAEGLDRASLAFLRGLTKTPLEILPFVGDEYLIDLGAVGFVKCYEALSRDDRLAVEVAIDNGEMLTGIRFAVASSLATRYGKEAETLSITQVQLNRSDDYRGSVDLRVDERRVPTEWLFEGGSWRLTSLRDSEKAEAQQSTRRSIIAKDFAYRGAVSVFAQLPFFEKEKIHAGVTFTYSQWTYFFFKISVLYGKWELVRQDTIFNKTLRGTGDFIGAEPSLGVQVPLRAGSVVLIPYLRGFYAMHYSLQKEQPDLTTYGTYRSMPGFGVGLDMAHALKSGRYILWGVEGKYLSTLQNFGNGKSAGWTVGANLGFTF